MRPSRVRSFTPSNITPLQAAAELARAAAIIDRASRRFPHTDAYRDIRRHAHRAIDETLKGVQGLVTEGQKNPS